MTVLNKIVKNRLKRIHEEKKNLSMAELKDNATVLLESGYRPKDFLDRYNNKKLFLIAEIKKSSPSKGLIRENFDIIDIINSYNNSHTVDAISILTEPDYFSGNYEYIKSAKEISEKAVLMKDFIIDPYQIYKGFLLGASAVLLIASILDDSQIEEYLNVASELGIKVIFETHTVQEYKRAANFDIEIIGINNRDLKTFVTDINNSIRIIEAVGKNEDMIIISESGIDSQEDIKLLSNSGIDGFLIGERFMKFRDIEGA
ncbi:MAG: indole-3-glycerol phosphate synthase TrpC, partial [Spirochaetota bacterium]|nr:indole-3-glycerol phosphate synthase TrpC [Spirochaetota bacterium]